MGRKDRDWLAYMVPDMGRLMGWQKEGKKTKSETDTGKKKLTGRDRQRERQIRKGRQIDKDREPEKER